MNDEQICKLADEAEHLVWCANIPRQWRRDITSDVTLELIQCRDQEVSVARVVDKHIKRWQRAAERDEKMKLELRNKAERDEIRTGMEEALHVMMNALECLDEKQRAVVVMREAYGHSWKQVADQSGLTIGAARRLNSRAKKELKQYMVSHGMASIKELL